MAVFSGSEYYPLSFRQHLTFMYPKQLHLICNQHFPFTEGATGTRVKQAAEGHLLGQRQQDSTGLQSPIECLLQVLQLLFPCSSHNFVKYTT